MSCIDLHDLFRFLFYTYTHTLKSYLFDGSTVLAVTPQRNQFPCQSQAIEQLSWHSPCFPPGEGLDWQHIRNEFYTAAAESFGQVPESR